MQQGDVLLFQSDNGGDIVVENGLVKMSGGLDTAAYLSLFGGNETDNEWWGNSITEHISETGKLLGSLPAISANLLRIEDAVNRDLKWMIETGVALKIAVRVTVPNINRVKIKIDIDGDNSVEFTENWITSL